MKCESQRIDVRTLFAISYCGLFSLSLRGKVGLAPSCQEHFDSRTMLALWRCLRYVSDL